MRKPFCLPLMSIKLRRTTKFQTNSELYKLRYELSIGIEWGLALTVYSHFIVSKTTNIINRFENRSRVEIYCFAHKIHKTLKNKQKHQIKVSEVVIHCELCVLCTYERTYVLIRCTHIVRVFSTSIHFVHG